MVAKGGSKLLQDNAINFLKSKLIPKTYLITPNIPETEILYGNKINELSDMKSAAKYLCNNLGCQNALVKGGHLDQKTLNDVLYQSEKDDFLILESTRQNTKNTHGTGCTYSAAIAANLALGKTLQDSVTISHEYLQKAIKQAPKNIGSGHGPLTISHK
jgi:hydroxymethylpyrimidine/phosphomethylpyrimidine kinase